MLLSVFVLLEVNDDVLFYKNDFYKDIDNSMKKFIIHFYKNDY